MALSMKDTKFYQTIKSKLPLRERQILETLEKFEICTSYEVADYIGVRRDVVSSRFSRLKNDYIITECGSKKNPSTNTNCLKYKIIDNPETRLKLIKSDFEELIVQRDQLVDDQKKGISEYSERILRDYYNRINSRVNRLRTILEDMYE